MRLEELDGTKDVDLGFTPATNTLPVRRLSLEAGATASVTAAWVKFPDLTMEVLPQRYTRLNAVHYRYESAGGTFVAELEMDELGIVVQYGNWWKRAGKWSEAGALATKFGFALGGEIQFRQPSPASRSDNSRIHSHD